MAFIDPLVVRLKDGREVLLRTGVESDVAAVLDHTREVLGDGTGQVTELDEFEDSVEREREWIRTLSESACGLLLVAEVGGQLVGLLDFHAINRRRMAHTGYIGLGLRPDWRGVGLGRAMLLRLKDHALATDRIEKINLRVLANNAPAIALYESVGFRLDGRKERELKLADGTYVDDLSMAWWVR